MRLPIRTDELEFIVATPPKAVPLFGAVPAQVRQDRDDCTIYAFNILATSGADADVLHIQVVGQVDVAVGEAVRLRTLTAECWEMEGHSGVSFRADGIERVAARGASGMSPGDGTER
jgi:hypothetical protein